MTIFTKILSNFYKFLLSAEARRCAAAGCKPGFVKGYKDDPTESKPDREFKTISSPVIHIEEKGKLGYITASESGEDEKPKGQGGQKQKIPQPKSSSSDVNEKGDGKLLDWRSSGKE